MSACFIASQNYSSSPYSGNADGLPSPANGGKPRVHKLAIADGRSPAGSPFGERSIAVSSPIPISATPSPRREHPSSAPDPQPINADVPAFSPAMQFLAGFASPPPVAKRELAPDAEGAKVGSYTLGSTIAYGGFSTVRKAYSSAGVVAVKIVTNSALSSNRPGASEAKDRVRHEAEIWSGLSHEHVLPLFSCLQTTAATYFFTMYCPAGSLLDILKRDGRPALPHDDAGMMFRQIVRGLRYLHDTARLVHGDIKLENVLVDEMGVCRISDFGLARPIPDAVAADYREPETEKPQGLPLHLSLFRGPTSRNRSATAGHPPTHPLHQFAAGSLPYASPELLLPHATHEVPNPAQDIWALGCVLHALLSGRLPFTDSYEPRLQMKILKGVWEVKGRPLQIGREARKVLRGCLEMDVTKRWTVRQIDDVAWNIGWAIEEEDEEDEEDRGIEMRRGGSRSRSRSRRGRERLNEVDVTRHVSRSRSRHHESKPPSRSQSRARDSAPMERNPSRSQSRARSRGPTMDRTGSADVSASQSRSSSRPPPTRSSSSGSIAPSTATGTSLSSSRGRGNASPSVTSPVTPVDAHFDFEHFAFVDSRQRSVSRGRRKDFRAGSSGTPGELEIVDETGRDRAGHD